MAPVISFHFCVVLSAAVPRPCFGFTEKACDPWWSPLVDHKWTNGLFKLVKYSRFCERKNMSNLWSVSLILKRSNEELTASIKGCPEKEEEPTARYTWSAFLYFTLSRACLWWHRLAIRTVYPAFHNSSTVAPNVSLGKLGKGQTQTVKLEFLLEVAGTGYCEFSVRLIFFS